MNPAIYTIPDEVLSKAYVDILKRSKPYIILRLMSGRDLMSICLREIREDFGDRSLIEIDNNTNITYDTHRLSEMERADLHAYFLQVGLV